MPIETATHPSEIAGEVEEKASQEEVRQKNQEIIFGNFDSARGAMISFVRHQSTANELIERTKYIQEAEREFSQFEKEAQWSEVSDDIEKARIIYVGDWHYSSASEELLMRIVKDIKAGHSEFAFAFEAVKAGSEEYYRQYLAGEISLTEFLRLSGTAEFMKGGDLTMYRDILKLAKKEQIDILGLGWYPEEKVSGEKSLVARDQKAADLITHYSEANPRKKLLVLFGRAHLSSGHLPRSVSEQMSGEIPAVQISPNNWAAFLEFFKDRNKLPQILKHEGGSYTYFTDRLWQDCQKFLEYYLRGRESRKEAYGASLGLMASGILKALGEIFNIGRSHKLHPCGTAQTVTFPQFVNSIEILDFKEADFSNTPKDVERMKERMKENSVDIAIRDGVPLLLFDPQKEFDVELFTRKLAELFYNIMEKNVGTTFPDTTEEGRMYSYIAAKFLSPDNKPMDSLEKKAEHIYRSFMEGRLSIELLRQRISLEKLPVT